MVCSHVIVTSQGTFVSRKQPRYRRTPSHTNHPIALLEVEIVLFRLVMKLIIEYKNDSTSQRTAQELNGELAHCARSMCRFKSQAHQCLRMSTKTADSHPEPSSTGRKQHYYHNCLPKTADQSQPSGYCRNQSSRVHHRQTPRR